MVTNFIHFDKISLFLIKKQLWDVQDAVLLHQKAVKAMGIVRVVVVLD
jgi:hypothetical protein